MDIRQKGLKMYNKVILICNLTRDIELKYTQGGSAIANLGVATNRKWKDKNTGELKEEVTFVDVTVFGKSAETANQYLKKGSKVLIDGRLKFDQWTDQSGQKRSKLSVVAESLQFLDSKKQSNQNQSYSQPQQNDQNNYQQPNQQAAPPNVTDGDQIPFAPYLGY